MKKICMCTTIPSSMETFILPIAKKLHESGEYDITVICDEDEKLKAIIPNYITYIPIKMRRGIDLTAASAIIKFYKVFKENKYDLVQYTTPNASLYASIAARICRIRVRIYNQWGLRYASMTGIKKTIFMLVEKITCKNSTHVRSASKKNMSIAVEKKICAKNKIKVIGQGGTIGVDLKQFDINKKEKWGNEIKTKYTIPKKSFVYGFAGRITCDKGCNELLKAFSEIDDPTVYLLMVGSFDTNDRIDEKLKQYAQSSERIIITGRIPNHEIQKYYSAFNVLVHPTYREGFGMVIQEAAAMKTPTITTNIPGASEVMVKNESCILVQPHDYKELRKAMICAKDNPEMIKQYGENAFVRAKKYFERNNMLELQLLDYRICTERKQ